MQSKIIVTADVVVYLLVMLLIGYLSSKKIESNTDFVVAGRRLGPFLMAGTLAATEIGGGSSLGVVQQGMESHGLSAAWYIITMGFAFVILTFLHQNSVLRWLKPFLNISAVVMENLQESLHL